MEVYLIIFATLAITTIYGLVDPKKAEETDK